MTKISENHNHSERLAITPVKIDSVVLPKEGLQLPRQLSFERWLSIGQWLSDLYNSSAWYLGDWLIYGEMAYTGRYREAIERTSLDYQTLRNYAWVARRFPLSRRRAGLSFGHHAEVAALSEPEQGFWLRKAEHHGWSRNRLRREVRSSLKEREPEHDSAPMQVPRQEIDRDSFDSATAATAVDAGPEVTLEIPVSSQQMESCQAAADMAGLDLEAWAALALGTAAQQELGRGDSAAL